MNSLDEQYGYDANFISDVSDSFKCNVCHLVMREPVQIMTCGHRFCKPCFERLKGYATHLNTQLRCPIDRDEIEIDKVFNDTAVSRDIGNLQVTCSYVAFGCSWKGDLRKLTDHEKECQHQINQNMQNQSQVANTENIDMVAELLKRIQSCENILNGKEKDIADMKYDIHELKTKYGVKEKEVTALKTLNEEIRREMSESKKINEKIREHFKSEIEILEKKNERLETRLNSLENHTKKCESLESEIKANETTVLELRNSFASKDQLENFQADISSRINLLETQIETNKTTIKECKDKSASKRQLENFKTNITNKLKEKEITKQPSIDSENNPIAQALKNISDDLLEFKLRIEKRLESLEILNTTFRKDTIHHLENIENVMFCHEPYNKEKNVKIKWLMTNFQKKCDSGEDVCSPIFYSSLQGYCFKLLVHWSGDDRQILGLFLKICLNKDTPVEQDGERDPFRIEYTLEIRHKDGESRVYSVPFANLDKYRETSFTILPNKNEARNACGNRCMLDKSTWDDYVINDMMLITCTFRTR